MQNQENINCYCFNEQCKKSIFNIKTCVPVTVSLQTALLNSLKCDECGKDLVSKTLIKIKKEINDVMNRQFTGEVIKSHKISLEKFSTCKN